MKIKPEKKYILNPAYILFPDNHCAYIANSKGTSSFSQAENADNNFLQLIMPVYAMLFSYWDGRLTYQETLDKISEETNIGKEMLSEFFSHCINNDDKILINGKNGLQQENQFKNWIPPFFIIPSDNGLVRTDMYPTKDFIIPKKNWDLEKCRSRVPLQLNLMLTNKCVTDCLYCYADKQHQIENPLSADKWISIIEEADRFGCLSIDIAGGEVFLFPGIEKILQCLYRHGYDPYLSTKIPLGEERILKLKESGLKELQLSIDAWDSQTLQKLLHVNANYFEQLKRSMKLLEKHGIHVKVKSVITRFNDSLQSIEKLLLNLTTFSNIEEISLAPAEFSIYKKMDGFLQYKTTLAQWERIKALKNEFLEKHPDSCIIDCQIPTSGNDFNDPAEEKKKKFKKRSRCTGNIIGLYILADGKVGICEELYWDPRFIVGDLRSQSILEVWNSPKALSLYNLSQNKFRKESACHNCYEFNRCHQQSGVCWKYVIEAYGAENWDYPDPRCPAAPPVINSFYIQ